MNARSPRLTANDCRGNRAGSRSTRERDLNVRAGQPRSEKPGNEGVARAGGVNHLKLWTIVDREAALAFGEKGRDASVAYAGDVNRFGFGRFDTPAALAFYGLGAGCPALDDDHPIVLRKSHAF